MATIAKSGMKAATAAAKEPVRAAQARGAELVRSATGSEMMALQSVQRLNEGESPLPDHPSGVSNRGAPFFQGTLPADFDQIREYLNILYPFTTPDPEDAYWQRRSQVVSQDGTVPGVGKAIIPPEYFDYTQRKLNQYLSDQFKTFVFSQIDLETPAAREFWETRFPEYTKEFREGWKRRLGHMARMGDMLINGVQNTEDLWYLFVTEKGLNPVAFQYQGPPNQSQVAALFNMYQQTIFPGTATPSARVGTPGGFGAGGVNNRFTGQILGSGTGPQILGQNPAAQF
jgi:hypothetical protein